ncbi:hypothetical protein AMTR_s00001p00272480 [Amborella trichopoda]|uniref:Uncharacterized protein n=1 Tax=Amborella trichopoda TaxID=13333 RepID=W1NMY7_AMBTC|nr:hypothetical protein AMTR_s00001p00272480 [Amborella trichopoda]
MSKEAAPSPNLHVPICETSNPSPPYVDDDKPLVQLRAPVKGKDHIFASLSRREAMHASRTLGMAIPLRMTTEPQFVKSFARSPLWGDCTSSNNLKLSLEVRKGTLVQYLKARPNNAPHGRLFRIQR